MGLSACPGEVGGPATRTSWSSRCRGTGATRVAVGARRCSRRGWRLALSPADADVLVVCGTPGPQLAEAVETRLAPDAGTTRARGRARRVTTLDSRLDGPRSSCSTPAHHRHDAHRDPTPTALLAEQDRTRDHGGHEDMDHERDGPRRHGDGSGGIPLAEGGEDRDGLEMDVLKVRLGPVLPHWPAGLVLRCSLQGDVIVEARAELLDGTAARDERRRSRLRRRLDNIASLLALAGWDDAAAEAAGSATPRSAARRRSGWSGARASAPAGPSSRTLRWSLRGSGR